MLTINLQVAPASCVSHRGSILILFRVQQPQPLWSCAELSSVWPRIASPRPANGITIDINPSLFGRTVEPSNLFSFDKFFKGISINIVIVVSSMAFSILNAYHHFNTLMILYKLYIAEKHDLYRNSWVTLLLHRYTICSHFSLYGFQNQGK